MVSVGATPEPEDPPESTRTTDPQLGPHAGPLRRATLLTPPGARVLHVAHLQSVHDADRRGTATVAGLDSILDDCLHVDRDQDVPPYHARSAWSFDVMVLARVQPEDLAELVWATAGDVYP